MSQHLLACLTREQAAIKVFIELLDQEAKAMTDGNLAHLPELAKLKSELAEQIKLLGQQREHEQLALGHAGDRRGAAAACAAGGKATLQAWHNLLECATQAREHNRRNGVMVHTHLDFTRQTIRFLQASAQPLYGPDGNQNTGTSGGNRLAVG